MPGPISDLDIRFERRSPGYRAIVLSSPAGEGHEVEFQSPFSDMELENFALRMQRGRGSRRIEAPQAKEAKERGERLYRALFYDDVLTCLQQSLASLHAGEGVLRIRLRLGMTPELANLPWEYLYDHQHNRFLCLWDRTPVVRYSEMSEPARSLQIAGPLRMVVMVSSPTDYPSLDVDEEWAKLNGSLAELVLAGRITLERLPDATLATLRRSLRRLDYHVFHFIGHGGFDPTHEEGVLVFTKGDGRGHWVSGERLGIELGNAPSIRLAVLNACEGARSDAVDPFSGVAQSLVQQGVPAVVAMQYEISDPAAIAFSSGFYGAVADGLSIEASMSQARRDVLDISDLEWATPVLYLRCTGSQLFEVGPAPAATVPRSEDDDAAAAEPDNGAGATARLNGARQRRELEEHSEQAGTLIEGGDWEAAISHLEAIVALEPSYPEAAGRLEHARHHWEVSRLRQEARRLYQAQQWEAVLSVGDRLKAVAPDEDPGEIFAAAQAALAEAEAGARAALAEAEAGAARELAREQVARDRAARRLAAQEALAHDSAVPQAAARQAAPPIAAPPIAAPPRKALNKATRPKAAPQKAARQIGPAAQSKTVQKATVAKSQATPGADGKGQQSSNSPDSRGTFRQIRNVVEWLISAALVVWFISAVFGTVMHVVHGPAPKPTPVKVSPTTVATIPTTPQIASLITRLPPVLGQGGCRAGGYIKLHSPGVFCPSVPALGNRRLFYDQYESLPAMDTAFNSSAGPAISATAFSPGDCTRGGGFLEGTYSIGGHRGQLACGPGKDSSGVFVWSDESTMIVGVLSVGGTPTQPYSRGVSAWMQAIAVAPPGP